MEKLPDPAPPPGEPRMGGARLLLLAVFGLGLPTVTLILELGSRLCAENAFDPLPTIGHVFVVAAVPLANLFTLRALGAPHPQRLAAVIFGQAFAAAVAAVYALRFLPLLPLGVMAIPLFGLGLLPLTPALSLIASAIGLRALHRLRDSLGRPRRRTGWAGLGAGLAVLIALQIPTTVTRFLVMLAASDDPATSRSGLSWLRRIGDSELLLRACYQRPSTGIDLVGAMLDVASPVPPGKMREIYYRVTGRPFDTQPPPRLGRASARRESDRDLQQGGDEVGVYALRGLSLASSRFDGSLDGRAALAYLEWTFELRNEAEVQREARAEVALPPGAVVSRVTLWVDGVEKEAAFAARDVTRRAYEGVVRARRDPILVTTSGPDRILVQCFPVPPGGGVMKARIGITAPLQLAGPAAATLGLPYFVQRNFSVPASVGHAVWMASKDRFAWPASPLLRAQVADGSEELRGQLAEPASPGPLGSVTVERPAPSAVAWTPEGIVRPASAGSIITQTLRGQPLPRPSRLIVVIDGSAAMKAAAPGLRSALDSLPAGMPVAITIAGDETRDLQPGLEDARFEGGAHSLPALIAAWDRAAITPGGAVLWIHGPQPVLPGPTAELRQRVERRRDGPRIYTYAALGGENRLLTNLADLPTVNAVPRLTAGTGDLQRFLRALAGAEPRLVAVRERRPSAIGVALAGGETSAQLARLWAADRIAELLRGPPGGPATAADREAALALARQYRLVTPISGAVVLETAAQYAAAGLEPGETSHVPTVPEPATWALLFLVAAILLVTARSRRRLARATHAR